MVDFKDIEANQGLTLKEREELVEEWGGVTQKRSARNQQLVVSSCASSSVGFLLPFSSPERGILFLELQQFIRM
jgi:hypothetical protein